MNVTFLIVLAVISTIVSIGSVIAVNFFNYGEKWYYLSVSSASITFCLLVLIFSEMYFTPKPKPILPMPSQSSHQYSYMEDSFLDDLINPSERSSLEKYSHDFDQLSRTATRDSPRSVSNPSGRIVNNFNLTQAPISERGTAFGGTSRNSSIGNTQQRRGFGGSGATRIDTRYR